MQRVSCMGAHAGFHSMIYSSPHLCARQQGKVLRAHVFMRADSSHSAKLVKAETPCGKRSRVVPSANVTAAESAPLFVEDADG